MTFVPTNIVPAIIQPSVEQREWDDAKAAFAKISELDLQRDEAMAEAGRRALQLKERTPAGWEKACKERLGVTPQWANTCIRVFTGKTTAGEVRAANRDKEQRLRDRGKKAESMLSTTEANNVVQLRPADMTDDEIRASLESALRVKRSKDDAKGKPQTSLSPAAS